MRIFLLGNDDATRDRQAELLGSMYAVPRISNQELIADAVASDSPLGHELRTILEQGGPITEQMMMALVKNRLHRGDCYNGFLFDSFPTTIQQAQTLVDQGVSIDFVIELLDKHQDISALEKTDSMEIFVHDADQSPSYILHSLAQKNHH